jgi:RNA polymerase sigma-70 factor, ECF subfamily
MGVPALAVVSDGELIARYLTGDEGAAADLVRRHAPALARWLAVQGAPDLELEDLVQDALFKAFRALGTFKGDASFRTWLLTIGANLLRDRQRQWKRRQVLALSPDVADPAADPAGETSAAAMAERLSEGLGKLARLQREVFLLRSQQGLDYDDIARALDISAGAARVHYHHAVKRLKQWMTS